MVQGQQAPRIFRCAFARGSLKSLLTFSLRYLIETGPPGIADLVQRFQSSLLDVVRRLFQGNTLFFIETNWGTCDGRNRVEGGGGGDLTACQRYPLVLYRQQHTAKAMRQCSDALQMAKDIGPPCKKRTRTLSPHRRPPSKYL